MCILLSLAKKGQEDVILVGLDIMQDTKHIISNTCSPFDLPKGPGGVIFCLELCPKNRQ